jgi:hypothetical protein
MRFTAPGEREAQERSWEIVRTAFEQREPVAWPRRHARPLVAGAVVAAVVAAALSPPGRSVVRSLREAVGVKKAEPGLFSLPTPGQLLVTSRSGAWLVRPDGSKRLLGRYRDAAFSPHGLFIAATRANQLVALDPKGHVRWTLARPSPRFPAWTGTRADTRIAYLSAGQLHVVAGDGTGDRAVGPASPLAPAWLRGPRRVVRYFHNGQMLLYDLASERIRSLGSYQDVRDPAIRRRTEQSEVVYHGRVVFRGTGVFEQVVPSPDGRWLLVSWPTANQWVFVRLHPRKIVGVGRITQQFGRSSRIAGWCCRR